MGENNIKVKCNNCNRIFDYDIAFFQKCIEDVQLQPKQKALLATNCIYCYKYIYICVRAVLKNKNTICLVPAVFIDGENLEIIKEI